MRSVWVWVVMIGLLGLPRGAAGYSVQTHEQLVDLSWKPVIVPLLLARYPGLTAAQLDEAHGYAYGGCAIQDVGYYPFGNEFFSDLAHYVRAGDFVRSLLRNAKTPDELAFAIGAMTHYVGDSEGHSLATNVSVPVEFAKLKQQYGTVVTYEDSPHAHVRTEFAFDINQISKRRFAPSRYLAHVGLNVATDLLARAFKETYGFDLDTVLGVKREEATLRGYRWSVRSFLPRIAYAETVLHRNHEPADGTDEEFVTFQKALAQSGLEDGWDRYRKKAGIGTYLVAGLIAVAPPLGPLAMAKIKGPTNQTERDYVRSVNASNAVIRRDVQDVQANDAKVIAQDLPNRDLDTGAVTRPGGYRLTDETYAQLLGRITKDPAAKVPAGLKADVQLYYADPNAPIATKKNRKKWAAVQRELGVLQGMAVVPEP